MSLRGWKSKSSHSSCYYCHLICFSHTYCAPDRAGTVPTRLEGSNKHFLLYSESSAQCFCISVTTKKRHQIAFKIVLAKLLSEQQTAHSGIFHCNFGSKSLIKNEFYKKLFIIESLDFERMAVHSGGNYSDLQLHRSAATAAASQFEVRHILGAVAITAAAEQIPKSVTDGKQTEHGFTGISYSTSSFVVLSQIGVRIGDRVRNCIT